MNDINAQIIFVALQKLIAIKIVFYISNQCAIMTETTLNMTLHGSKCNQ